MHFLLPPTQPGFTETLGKPLRAASSIKTLQINLGLVCNLACRHCHVESSPKRRSETENMSGATADKILDWLTKVSSIETVDLTGGSPEMNPQFRRVVDGCRSLGKQVMDRCNPTILVHKDANGEKAYGWAPEFLASRQVQVVASLPCYLEENVRKQRGLYAYDDSIAGLQLLNEVGYGKDPALSLTLVYNPGGPHLPPSQEQLEVDYRSELRERFGIEFNKLIAITNMPIKRWRTELEREGKLEEYLQLIANAYNPDTVEGLMCRHQIHTDSQGRLHDCDFNYALELRSLGNEHAHLWDLDPEKLAKRPIATADHCFGCTAGQGSSCGGTLADG